MTLATDTNAKLAQQYISAYKTNKGKNNAIEFLQRGVQVAPDISDLWLFLAEEQIKIPFGFASALESVSASVKANKWIARNLNEAMVVLAGLQIRTGSYEDAAVLLDRTYSRSEIVKLPEVALQRITLYFLFGQKAEAHALLADCLTRYPENPGFVSVGLQYGDIPVSTAFLWLNRYSKTNADLRDVLFWYVRAIGPSLERLTRVNDYIKRGGRDQLIYLYGMESELSLLNVGEDQIAVLAPDRTRARIEQDWIGSFTALPSPLDMDVVVAMDSMAQESNSHALIRSRIGTGRQEFYRDYNRDGSHEEQLVFDDGSIRSWDIDLNQDDIVEYAALWDNGAIAAVRHDDRASTTRFVYSDYPEVSEVWVSDASGSREYKLGHRAEELTFVEFPETVTADPVAAASYLKVPSRLPNMAADRIREKAFVVNEFKPGKESGLPYRQVSLDRGAVRAFREDSNNDGIYDHVVWYETGHPKVGFRDIEDSGAFNVLELFQQDRVVETRFQKDGLSYSYRPVSGRSYWDLNGDNTVDVQEMRIRNRTLLADFAEALTSSFDMKDWQEGYPMIWSRALIDNK